MIPDNAPQWLKNANTRNADVEILDDWPFVLWRGGEWIGGTWVSGEWLGGVWRGGIWHNGVWRGGEWRGGEWWGGEWHGGIHTCRSKYIPLICQDGEIKIGCEKKAIVRWDKWFSGTEELETKRTDPAFKMIEAHYRAVREYALFMGLAKEER